MKLKQNVLSMARGSVCSLPIYDSGVSVDRISNENPAIEIHNLSVNENPFGMSPKALSALQNVTCSGALYPDGDCTILKEKLSEAIDISPDRIVVGNGSEDILSMLCRVFINDGDRVVIPKPTFSLHHIYAAMMGADIVEVPVDALLKFNVDGWLNTLKTLKKIKILMLANPSNPVGCILSHAELAAVVEVSPDDALLVIDEAYVEYAAGNKEFPRVFEILQNQHRPWVVLRTFSKAYGLAGLRVGYGVCSDATIVSLLNRIRTPYNVNRLAQFAAVHALADQAHLAQTVAYTVAEREKLRASLLSCGIPVAPSCSNFIFVDTQRSSVEVANALLQQNILVKAWKEHGYDSFIRISVGRQAQNALALRELRKLLN